MEELGSSSGSSSKQSAARKQTFLLHVLSPSADFPNKVTFPDVPISATVGELKIRICKAVESGPSPELQRLIYRGKPLAQDTALLKDVLTQETIDRSESISLHLVLPPAVSSQPSISSASSKSAQPGTTQQPAGWLPAAIPRRNYDSQQMPARNINHENELPSPPPPPPPQNSQPHDNPSTNIPYGVSSSLPPHIQQAMRNYLQTFYQHFAPQLPVDGNVNFSGHTSNPSYNHPSHISPEHDQFTQSRSNPGQPAQQSDFQPLSLNQILAQQQQLRAAGGLHGLGSSHFQQRMQSNLAPIPLASPLRDASASSGAPEQHRVVPPSTSSTSDDSTQEVFTCPPESASGPQKTAASSDRLPSGNLRVGRSQESLDEEKLSIIESALANTSSLNESVFETLRTQLQTIQTHTEASRETLRRLGARLEAISGRAEQLRVHVNGILVHVTGENTSAQRAPTPTPAATANSNSDNSVYLLSSPSGPYALLVSPSGLYTAPWHFPTLTSSNSDPNLNQTLDQSSNGTTFSPQSESHENNSHLSQANSNLNGRTPRMAQPSSQIQPGMERQQQPQQEQQEQPNQFQDLARALVPMGGHIWLLVRLFGFVYFFTGGGGYVRTIVLGLCALVVFIAQSGVFRPFLQSVWEPLRRHLENILPLAANDRIAQGANAGNNANGARDRAAPGAEAVPTPHQAAERLLREHERRDGSIIRQNLRRLERALALFVASLVPGVGERHIAARDAAEAARREEERLREENARREEEERMEERRKGKQRDDGGGNREPVMASHGQNHVDTITAAET